MLHAFIILLRDIFTVTAEGYHHHLINPTFSGAVWIYLEWSEEPTIDYDGMWLWSLTFNCGCWEQGAVPWSWSTLED